MRRLRRRVDDERRPFGFEKIAHALSIANVQLHVAIGRQRTDELFHYRTCRARGAEELPAHVVVGADDLPAFRCQQSYAFRTDETA